MWSTDINKSRFQRTETREAETCRNITVSIHANGSCGGKVFTTVCLFFRTIYQKPTKLRSPMHNFVNFDKILGSNGQGQGHESQKQCRRGSLHSCECWLLLVYHCRLWNVHKESGYLFYNFTTAISRYL